MPLSTTKVALAVTAAGVLTAGAAAYPPLTRPGNPVRAAGAELSASATTAFAARGHRDAAERVTGRANALVPAAVGAVRAAGGVPVAGGGTCPADRLAVSFDDPGKGWTTGAYISPVGPAPGDATTEVNGVVLCAGSHYAFVGFEAVLSGGRWVVELVPDPAGGVADDGDEHEANDADTAPAPAPAPAAAPIAGRFSGSGIEGYARYEGQSVCDPAAKPGTLALRNLLLARYPSTRSLGISRACGVGGRSEHKEGRAFDWGAYVTSPAQRASVESFLSSVFATDAAGNRHALVRRMGIMYIIWNHQIWSAYRADAGWRPYTGSSPHTDHAHISLSWAGARGQTSFWSGTVVPGLPDAPLATGGSSSGSSSRSSRTVSAGTRTPRVPRTQTVRRSEGGTETRRRRVTTTPAPDRDRVRRTRDGSRDGSGWTWDGSRDGTRYRRRSGDGSGSGTGAGGTTWTRSRDGGGTRYSRYRR